jgi:hypothetical protein
MEKLYRTLELDFYLGLIMRNLYGKPNRIAPYKCT